MSKTMARNARPNGLRSFAASIGPSIVLDGLLAASTAATVATSQWPGDLR
jgi:hypothetical protein